MHVYLTTNLVNGKGYIGKCSTDSSWYLGSGQLLIAAIKKYGRENFQKTILEKVNSLEELTEREKYWINHYNALGNDKFYNLREGGDGGDTWSKRSKISQRKTSQKLSKANSKPFTLVSSVGKEIYCQNVRDAVQRTNLSYSQIARLKQGAASRTQWRVKGVTTVKNVHEFKLISPNHVEYFCSSVRNGAHQTNLTAPQVQRLQQLGKSDSGWKCVILNVSNKQTCDISPENLTRRRASQLATKLKTGVWKAPTLLNISTNKIETHVQYDWWKIHHLSHKYLNRLINNDIPVYNGWKKVEMLSKKGII